MLGMGNFRMELNAVDLLLIIVEGSNRTRSRIGRNPEARRNLLDKIGMAHPAHGDLRNALEQYAHFMGKFGLAIFAACLGRLHFATCKICDQLTSVTDTEDRDPGIQDSGIEFGRFLIIYAVRTSGKNDPFITALDDLLDGYPVVWNNFGI